MRPTSLALLATVAFAAWGVLRAGSSMGASGGSSRVDACSGVPSLGGVELVGMPMSFSLSNSVDSTGIDLRSRTLTAYLGKGWHANGLASAAVSFEPSMMIQGKVRADGACIGLLSLKVTYGYRDPVEILVASRYPEGSCRYAQVVRHEFEHYEIYRSSAFDDADAKRSALVSYVRSRLPVRATTEEGAKAMIRQVVDEAVRSLSDGVTSEGVARNATIDTPENYARIQALCPPGS